MKRAIGILILSGVMAYGWVKIFERKDTYWITETVERADGDTLTVTRASNFPPTETLDK